MLELQGIPVSPGVAIGPALILDSDGYRIPRSLVAAEEADQEYARLGSAFTQVARELESARLETSAVAGNETGDIFGAQLQMLQDPGLRRQLKRRVCEHHESAAYAVNRELHQFVDALRKLANPILAQRAEDVLDIEKQLLLKLGAVTGQPLKELSEPAIILSHTLTPSETANLDRRYVRGFCTEIGGSGGHTAIVAKGLELPAVVGIGTFIDQVQNGDLVILDGERGVVIASPDQDTIAEYEARMERRQSLSLRLAELRDLPAETTDGTRVRLSANIEFPHETVACLQRGADGIGLYRTEFLYLSSEEEPSETDHYEAYSQVIHEMNGRPVVIRTLDLGADKMGHRPLAEQEYNPFLGVRSIRLSLRNLDLFRPQLRAILRAAFHGDVRVMFPLITTIAELRQARMLLKVVADDLSNEGIAHRSDLPVGMMVEVPSAVVMLDKFACEVDFLSIGTNDLAQYALAVDRSNEYVADLYQSSDPAVLRLIQRCVEVANQSDTPLAVCGEMSSMPQRAMLLLGLGVRNLSVPPLLLPPVKKMIRSVSIAQCEEVATRVMKLEASRDIDMYLMGRLEEFVPELVVT